MKMIPMSIVSILPITVVPSMIGIILVQWIPFLVIVLPRILYSHSHHEEEVEGVVHQYIHPKKRS